MSTPPRRRAPARRAKAPAKPWEGRFSAATDALVEAFTVSVESDFRLATQDIAGSVAHVRSLGRAGILPPREITRLERGLRAVEREIRAGRFRVRPGDEDVHMAVERRLTELVGEVGGKVHTGRSRNDQVATDLRLWLREQIDTIDSEIAALIAALGICAERDLDVALPGYTHLQRAQPVLLAHHWLAYVEMLLRDQGRLRDCRQRLNVLPLGAGALAGSGFAIDRARVARELGFASASRTSLDAVSDRDFVVEFLAAAALIAVHLSRLAEEIVLWSGEEFGFIDLPDAFATGSSMMPQKKNPDVAELTRGRSGRVIGALVAVLTMLKGLPLAYNRDLQEDKPPLFEAIDVLRPCLQIMARMMPRLRPRRERMAGAAGGFALATELADFLVGRGLPFRQAHAVVGRIVGACVEQGRALEDLSRRDLAAFHPLLDHVAARRVLSVDAAIARRRISGGTARRNAEQRLAELRTDGLLGPARGRRRG